MPVATLMRSSGGFRPDQIAGLYTWFDATRVVSDGDAAADADPVSSWTNHGTTGNAATQTGTKRPVYKTGIQNGLPVVRFDADAFQHLKATAGVDASSNTGSFFAAAKRSRTGGQYIWDGADNNRMGDASDATTWTAYNGAVLNLTTASNNGTWAVWWIVFNTASSSLGWNTASGTGDAGNGTTASQSLFLGTYGGDTTTSNYKWHGDIGEFLFYNAVLSAADVQQVTRYLGAKWGITVA